MEFNTSYLNKTPNKSTRSAANFKPIFVVWHETGGYGSLEWNLKPEAASSYNYLITRNGTVYHYVDERRYIAWHAGKGALRAPWNGLSRWPIGGVTYVGSKINSAAIGVEVEGMNDGTQISAAQAAACVVLLRYFRDTYAIPIEPAYHPEHTLVAPYYKDDARGYTIGTLLDMARAGDKTPAQRFDEAHTLNGGVWRGPGLLSLGLRQGDPFLHNGAWHQRYERGVGRLEGDTVVWLLLSEIAHLP